MMNVCNFASQVLLEHDAENPAIEDWCFAHPCTTRFDPFCN